MYVHYVLHTSRVTQCNGTLTDAVAWQLATNDIVHVHCVYVYVHTSTHVVHVLVHLYFHTKNIIIR